MLYIIQYKPNRSDFINTITKDESDVLEVHFNYLKELFDQRKARLIGRREDGDFGIAILEAATLSEATAILNKDPIVNTGIFLATIGEFKLVFGSFA